MTTGEHESASAQELQPTQIVESIRLYEQWRDEHDSAIRIGIFGEDLERAYQNPDTVYLTNQSEEGSHKFPLLVPIEDLEWFNGDLLKSTFGEDTRALVYVHPPVGDEASWSEAQQKITEKLEQGFVIVTDKYADDESSPIANVVEAAKNGNYKLEAFGGDSESRADMFAGKLLVRGSYDAQEAPTLSEIYQEAVSKGELVDDPVNGVAFEDVIEGEEAEKLWALYSPPFEDLGANDPVHAGFDKDSLLELLKDPAVSKITKRVDGDIVTLCFFLHNFEKAPWFNKHFYERNYPEYSSTGNILMFPGIVSDENKRGNHYSMDVIDLATKVASKRDSSALVTFECTQESTKYIPQIVEAAINASEDIRIHGLDKPIGSINYYAIKSKTTN